jgi:hypothetical protein
MAMIFLHEYCLAFFYGGILAGLFFLLRWSCGESFRCWLPPVVRGG